MRKVLALGAAILFVGSVSGCKATNPDWAWAKASVTCPEIALA